MGLNIWDALCAYIADKTNDLQISSAANSSSSDTLDVSSIGHTHHCAAPLCRKAILLRLRLRLLRRQLLLQPLRLQLQQLQQRVQLQRPHLHWSQKLSMKDMCRSLCVALGCLAQFAGLG